MAHATLDETDEVVTSLREAAERLYEHDIYREAFEEAGLEPSDIDSIDRFRQLPAMDASDQAQDITENPPFGESRRPGRRGSV